MKNQPKQISAPTLADILGIQSTPEPQPPLLTKQDFINNNWKYFVRHGRRFKIDHVTNCYVYFTELLPDRKDQAGNYLYHLNKKGLCAVPIDEIGYQTRKSRLNGGGYVDNHSAYLE